ncbi:MAG TPA: hypothetical protein VMM18_17305 [Gemmatimonadaceae bacterium]|nr:hypothetical protein [Gemmatimonadaceae bacterium]
MLEALNRTQGSEGALWLGDIAVIDADDPLLRLLRPAVPPGPVTGAIR